MNLKDRIENNLTLYSISLSISAFGAGVAADRWAKEIFTPTSQVGECKAEAWQALAQKDDWLPKSQCPAYPLKLIISSPGTGTTIAINDSWPKTLKTPFIITTSRSLPGDNDIGFVVKPKDSQNYYVIFPLISRTSETNTYRADYGIDLPSPLKPGSEYEVRGILIDKKEKLGDRFTEISQILEADQSVTITTPISIVIEK